MRNIVLILAFIVCAFATKAQDLTFDETVEYIQQVLVENKSSFWPATSKDQRWYVSKVTARKDGRVSFIGLDGTTIIGSVNLFDVYEFECNDDYGYLQFSSSKKERCSNYSDEMCYTSLGQLYDISPENCLRLRKAFIYLKSLCTDKDPFGN